MKIDRLDHLVVTVHNVDRTVAFYSDVLGMNAVVFRGGRKALQFGNQKINLHPSDGPYRPHAQHPAPGSSDLCFITSSSPAEVLAHLEERGVPVEEGPVSRTGAVGAITSVYFRDPDGNLVEVAVYE